MRRTCLRVSIIIIREGQAELEGTAGGSGPAALSVGLLVPFFSQLIWTLRQELSEVSVSEGAANPYRFGKNI